MLASKRNTSDTVRNIDIAIIPMTVRSECTKVSSGIATKVSANGNMKPMPICAVVVIHMY